MLGGFSQIKSEFIRIPTHELFSFFVNGIPTCEINFPANANIFLSFALHFLNYVNHFHTYEIGYPITEIEFPFDEIKFPANETDLEKYEL